MCHTRHHNIWTPPLARLGVLLSNAKNMSAWFMYSQHCWPLEPAPSGSSATSSSAPWAPPGRGGTCRHWSMLISLYSSPHPPPLSKVPSNAARGTNVTRGEICLKWFILDCLGHVSSEPVSNPGFLGEDARHKHVIQLEDPFPSCDESLKTPLNQLQKSCWYFNKIHIIPVEALPQLLWASSRRPRSSSWGRWCFRTPQ